MEEVVYEVDKQDKTKEVNRLLDYYKIVTSDKTAEEEKKHELR